MELAYSPTSPYVRKVMVVLHETGQLADVTTIRPALNPFTFDPALVAVNSLAKVPALTTDQGRVLYDSRVICAYLDDCAGAGFYGAGPEAWDMRTLEATADGILDAAFNIAVEVRFRPAEIRFPEWMDGQWRRIENGLAAINDRWMDHLTGPLNIGQIAVGCALGYLDYRHGPRGWRDDVPDLAAWFESFAARPSMQATAPVAPA